MTFKPTDEQVAIRDYIANSKDGLEIRAHAGAAKTSTLEFSAPYVPQSESPAAMAFNVKIKKELERRMPSYYKILTVNGAGHRAWGKTLGRKLTLEERKMGQIITTLLREQGLDSDRELWTEVKDLAERARIAGLVPAKGAPGHPKRFVEDELSTWMLWCQDAMIDFTEQKVELARAALLRSIGAAFQGIIDYSDQIYMSCQPAGTKVAVANVGPGFHWKNIEEVTTQDKVVSYSRQYNKFVGFYNHANRVTQTAKRLYSGTLYTVYVDEKRTKATHDHKWLVRFKPNLADSKRWFVYLMERNGSFKVGTTSTISVRPNGDKCFGLAARCTFECADRAWVLSEHFSEEDARLHEAMTSVQFGITDVTYKVCNYADAIHKWQASQHWHRHRAEVCLEYFNRDIRYPFWQRNSTRSLSQNFVLETCNLLPGLMELCLFEGAAKGVWKTLDLTWERVENLPVYSMDVESNELYVADGILTHNCCYHGTFERFRTIFVDEAQDLSELNHYMLRKMVLKRLIAVGDTRQAIYSFRGALSNSMDRLRETFAPMATLTLSTTFRCSKAVVRHVEHHAPGIQAAPWAPEGSVTHLRDLYTHLIEPGSLVACRNHAPLIKLGLKLLRDGIPATFVKGDIRKPVEKLINKASGSQSDMSTEAMLNNLDALEYNAGESDIMADRIECVRVLAEGTRSVGEVLAKLERIFSVEDAIITLGTGHAVKGLEFESVYHLDPWRIPSKYAVTEEQVQQESNLHYVIATRAKRNLYYIDLERVI